MGHDRVQHCSHRALTTWAIPITAVSLVAMIILEEVLARREAVSHAARPAD
jgi:hypothetical protein